MSVIRQMIAIDQDLCNGCGLCIGACHEAAIELVDGKARVIRDDYCDGLGNCLPVCPTGAISFVTREAAPYDQAAVDARLAEMGRATGCPGAQATTIEQPSSNTQPKPYQQVDSQLGNFPVQLQLVAPNAYFFQDAHLLVAADCAAYAMGDFHRRFMKDRVTLIGCPKLDEMNYAQKLEEILRTNNILSVTTIRMEVPCCGGLERAAIKAMQDCGKDIPHQVLTLTVKGEVVPE